MAPKPVTATIFAYQVGFGDCFLLRFDYDDDSARHILIDFGTMGLPKDDPTVTMKRVAEDIAEKCNGELDIVVATHRHADHISGFETKDGEGSGDIIRKLKPKRVIQPWTEAPDAPEKWEGPEGTDPAKAFAARRQSLEGMNAVAEAVVARLDRDGGFDSKWPLAPRLRFIGEDNIKNKSAVKNLMTMAGETDADKANYLYVFHGCDLDLEAILPGVKIHVLGPPTLRQTQTIKKQTPKSAEEFWLRAEAMLALDADGGPATARNSMLFPGIGPDDSFRKSRLPAEMRWVAERVDEAEAEQMLGIVTQLDKAMNNTSVILLFEAGGKKLLFPGDAQLENWMYALQSQMAKLLDDVDLYKVGHHGSLNATPKSMWNRFAKRGEPDKGDRLTSLMSTMAGKHGGKHGSPTEVPRRPLVDELKAESNLVNTQDLAKGVPFQKLVFNLR
ncbi:MAG TPA: hypothetical protein VIT45_12800 [Allosphingosinicella sp.]